MVTKGPKDAVLEMGCEEFGEKQVANLHNPIIVNKESEIYCEILE
jgi:flagellar assembly factor FliW